MNRYQNLDTPAMQNSSSWYADSTLQANNSSMFFRLKYELKFTLLLPAWDIQWWTMMRCKVGFFRKKWFLLLLCLRTAHIIRITFWNWQQPKSYIHFQGAGGEKHSLEAERNKIPRLRRMHWEGLERSLNNCYQRTVLGQCHVLQVDLI